jgi:hypothetical protein
METLTQNPLEIAVIETGVSNEIAKDLTNKFIEFLEQADEWKQRAESLVVTSVDQVEEMKMAREARLALRQIRINADKTRKDLKEDSLRYGRAVQSVYNVIESSISPIEAHLENQEKFKEREEARQRDILRNEREALAADYRDYIPYGIDLGTLTQLDWDRLYAGALLQSAAAIQAAEAAEAERIAKELEAEKERERLRIENEKLKAEAAEKEKERQAELDRLEVEMRKANIAAAKAKKEAEQKAEEERKERERLQKELDDKKAAEAKAEADRLAAIEAELSKGDKQKLVDLISDLESLKTKFEFKSKKYKILYLAVTELLEKIIVYIKSKN